MNINIYLKDRSIFEISPRDIRSIVVKRDILDIKCKKKNFKFENHNLDYFSIDQGGSFNRGDFCSPQNSFSNNLVSILINILKNLE